MNIANDRDEWKHHGVAYVKKLMEFRCRDIEQEKNGKIRYRHNNKKKLKKYVQIFQNN